MKLPTLRLLATALVLCLPGIAFAGLEPLAPLAAIPPLPSLMDPDAVPLGTPVDPSSDLEDVANAPGGSAPAAGSNRGGAPAPGAGTDNHVAKPPAPGATPSPNLPDINHDAKPPATGLKNQDNPKGPNEQTQTGKGKPAPDSSNRENRKHKPNNPDEDFVDADANGASEEAPEQVDNGSASSIQGAGGANGKQGTGRNNPGGHAGGGKAKFPPLSPLDESMDPEFDPPGAPTLPSQCAEDSDCVPCFDAATAVMDKQRVNLEKLRSIYDYTHKFTREGTEVLSAAGASGGGVAQLGAAAEIHKVNGALDSFDLKVKNKSTELLGNLDEGVKQMAQCEAKYMHDDTWYSHHGQVYMQFMKGHYAF
ncbi:MAG: hypothetical protein ABI588_04890 [Arenimonas sp.]